MNLPNRIGRYYPAPSSVRDENNATKRPIPSHSAPRCKTTRIGHSDASMTALDVLGAAAWCCAVVCGLAAGVWVAGVVFGWGVRVGMGL